MPRLKGSIYLQEMSYRAEFSSSSRTGHKKNAGNRSTHRPPCTLMIGLPVLVIETSCSPLREMSEDVTLQALWHWVTARNPSAGETHLFGMVK